MKPKLFFWVQHLLGIGHVVRASRLAEALAEAFDVTLVMGGPLIAGLSAEAVTICALPSITAGPQGLSELVDAQGRPLTAAYRQARQEKLLDLYRQTMPDILMTEAFPFGRKALRFELIPLLEDAKSQTKPPLIVSSVRDILQAERKVGRSQDYVQLVEKFFDFILVHGDPQLVPFEASFPLAGQIVDKIHYTGLIAPKLRPATTILAPIDVPIDVIVSVGGGAVGEQTLRTALAAKPLSALAKAHWLFVTGPNDKSSLFDEISQSGDPTLSVARFLPDLPAHLHRIELSISQAGYNSVADLLSAHCRAVLVPFAEDGESEQTMRAQKMIEQQLATMPVDASPQAMAEAINAAMALPLPLPQKSWALSGAQEATAFLTQALKQHQRG